uniref:Uncharacterized protein n=1 Tax=Brassica oleracea TaxID=3712 RepID=A0A3P6FBT0_BRAOL|nr:unnamed protein product [Brassica oleracea]
MRFPQQEVTCGGKALRGLNVCVEVVKNKLAPGKKRSEAYAKEGNSHLIEREVVDGKDAAKSIWWKIKRGP